MQDLTRESMQGGARELVDAEELARHPAAGQIVFEPRLSRPRYFDGRFLAARDLTREQTYFLERQSLLGRALGPGVVTGLEVRPGTPEDAAALGRTSSADLLVIAAGQGITPGGELVGLREDQPVALAQLAESERLNAAFGLQRRPQPPARSRTGVFVLGLRAVEYTANPVSSYPTSIAGRRTVEHGNVIEATATTLVPYRMDDSAAPGQRRARLAHELFVEAILPGLPAGVLPLAMVALDRGAVSWVDPWLVRRETGRGDLPGLTSRPRALREAHFLHYRDHLEDVLAERGQGGVRFAASEYFAALPPAGPMPAAAVSSQGDHLTQLFFPPEVDCELSIVPGDEVPALFEESLLMPPIDLTGPGGDLEGTAALVLVPVPRARFDAETTLLEGTQTPLRPAIPGFFARRRPLDRLRGLELRRLAPAAPTHGDPATARWRELLAEAPELVYVRRRHLRYRDAAVSAAVTSETEATGDTKLVEVLKAHRLHARYRRIVAGNASDVEAAVSELVASPGVAGNRMLLDSALCVLAARRKAAGDVTVADVETVRESHAHPEIATGVKRIEAACPGLLENSTVANNLAKTGAVPGFARLAARARDLDAVETLAREVEEAGRKTGAAARRRLSRLIAAHQGKEEV